MNSEPLTILKLRSEIAELGAAKASIVLSRPPSGEHCRMISAVTDISGDEDFAVSFGPFCLFAARQFIGLKSSTFRASSLLKKALVRANG
jgi:hypothetical protein